MRVAWLGPYLCWVSISSWGVKVRALHPSLGLRHLASSPPWPPAMVSVDSVAPGWHLVFSHQSLLHVLDRWNCLLVYPGAVTLKIESRAVCRVESCEGKEQYEKMLLLTIWSNLGQSDVRALTK